MNHPAPTQLFRQDTILQKELPIDLTIGVWLQVQAFGLRPCVNHIDMDNIYHQNQIINDVRNSNMSDVKSAMAAIWRSELLGLLD